MKTDKKQYYFLMRTQHTYTRQVHYHYILNMTCSLGDEYYVKRIYKYTSSMLCINKQTNRQQGEDEEKEEEEAGKMNNKNS